MTYLLDTMIVSYFLESAHEKALAEAAKRLPMAIVGEVRRELWKDTHRGGAPFEKWLAVSNIEVREIKVGSEESGTLAQLQNPGSGKGLGERASIAIAAWDASLTFVTHDHGAVRIALRELWSPGERVMGPAVFLRRLVDSGAAIDPIVLDDVIALAGAVRATWWPSWRAGIASPTR